MKRISIREEDFLKALEAPVTASAPKKKKSALEEELDKIWDKYNPKPELELEKELSLGRVEYTPPTAEELERRAKELLGESQEKEKSAYLDGARRLAEKLESGKLTAREKAAERAARAEETFAQAEKEGVSKAIRQGLGRSSVNAGQKEAASAARAGEINALSSELGETLSGISGAIGELETEKKEVLGRLEAEHAAEIREKIDALAAAAKKEETAAAKANNDAAAKEAAYNRQVKEENEKAKAEYDRLLAEYDSRDARYIEDDDYYTEVVPAALEYYMTMDPQTAYEEAKGSEELKKRLGKYYNVVLSRLEGRI